MQTGLEADCFRRNQPVAWSSPPPKWLSLPRVRHEEGVEAARPATVLAAVERPYL